MLLIKNQNGQISSVMMMAITAIALGMAGLSLIANANKGAQAAIERARAEELLQWVEVALSDTNLCSSSIYHYDPKMKTYSSYFPDPLKYPNQSVVIRGAGIQGSPYALIGDANAPIPDLPQISVTLQNIQLFGQNFVGAQPSGKGAPLIYTPRSASLTITVEGAPLFGGNPSQSYPIYLLFSPTSVNREFSLIGCSMEQNFTQLLSQSPRYQAGDGRKTGIECISWGGSVQESATQPGTLDCTFPVDFEVHVPITGDGLSILCPKTHYTYTLPVYSTTRNPMLPLSGFLHWPPAVPGFFEQNWYGTNPGPVLGDGVTPSSVVCQ